MSYGTIMILKMKSPATVETLLDALKKWEERKVPGYQGSWVLSGEDDGTVVSCVSFDSKELYDALSNDSAQDEWWQGVIAPMLDGDAQ